MNRGREQLEARLAEAREAPAFNNYLRARDWVLKVGSNRAGEGVDEPSAYWTDELETLDYLFDASPLVIEKLRHHTYPVTGIRAYDYRSGKDAARERFSAKLQALIKLGGRDLLVPESPLLGGFGHEIDGDLYNIDTLKFYEVLIAMERGGILGGFRDASERKLVWEIGAGWGGFPYAFKTLFPNVTYVITDLPELFLFSATYLTTLFPKAKVMFYGKKTVSMLESSWQDYDFVFVPNTAMDSFRFPCLDLTLNMVSFQEMTEGQVDRYVTTAFEHECPLLYSLNRERSNYNEELESVTATIERRYWPRVIPVLPVNYMKMLPAKSKKDKASVPAENEYKHIVGSRRMPS